MKRRWLFLPLLALLAAGGFVASTFAVGEGEHVACTPTHTILDNGNPLGEISGECVTATDQTVTGPTTTETVHDTVTQTVTVTVGTTTAPPPPPPPPPPSGTANLWVAPGAGGCSRSATPVILTAGVSCPSFAAAYTAAQSGDVIGVTGTLPQQSFAGGYQATQGAGTKILTFKGVTGNVVRGIHSGSPDLTFDGLNVDCGGVKSSGACVENGGGDRDKWLNMSIGNVVDEKAALVDGDHLVFDNVRFHDAVIKTDGVHLECLYAIVVPYMTIRNSTFTNCAVFDVLFTYGSWWSPLPPAYGNVTLEGNQFGVTYSLGGGIMYESVHVGDVGTSNNGTNVAKGSIVGWALRNNRFDLSVTGFDPPRPVTASTFCGNTGSVPSSWQQGC
jgi:hypothetical protein